MEIEGLDFIDWLHKIRKEPEEERKREASLEQNGLRE